MLNTGYCTVKQHEMLLAEAEGLQKRVTFQTRILSSYIILIPKNKSKCQHLYMCLYTIWINNISLTGKWAGAWKCLLKSKGTFHKIQNKLSMNVCSVMYVYSSLLIIMQIAAENERLQGLSMVTGSSVGQEDYNVEYQAFLARNVQLQFSIMDPSPPHPVDHLETHDYHLTPRKPFQMGYICYSYYTYIPAHLLIYLFLIT